MAMVVEADSLSSSPANPNPNSPSPCKVCGENPWKYRCPGCSILTCSLPCVKSHKQRTGCTGQKSRADIIPISRFDDNLLLSDYNFLEEAKRQAEAARRARRGISDNSNFRLPRRLFMLRNAANRRRMRVLFLPQGMTKRERNRSIYNKRNNSILWTIEWRFHSTNVVLIDHGIDECNDLHSAVEKHLKPSPWNHELRSFCTEDINKLRYFLPKDSKDSKTLYRELKAKIPLGQQMADVVIVEYPVIFVYLPSHVCNFELEKDPRVVSVNEKPSGTEERIPSPSGIIFREEEIEEDNCSETQVMDMMHSLKAEVLDGFQNSASPSGRPVISTQSSVRYLDNKRQAHEETNIYSHSTIDSSLMLDFDFEQGLKDAYSDLVGELNPDDFLCFDGGCPEYCGMGVKEPYMDTNTYVVEDELEEGEIPS